MTLTEPTNDDPGAAPYFTVRYGVRAKGRAGVTRYTPDLGRAHELLVRFLADVTRPAALRPATLPPPLPRPRPVRP